MPERVTGFNVFKDNIICIDECVRNISTNEKQAAKF